MHNSLSISELQTLHAATAQLVQGERVIKKPNRTKKTADREIVQKPIDGVSNEQRVFEIFKKPPIA